MYKRFHSPPAFVQKQIIKRRALVAILLMATAMGFLLSRVAYLQIADHQRYSMLSKRNQLRIFPIAPARGLIYDRHGRLLARNVPAFHLALTPEQVPNLRQTLEDLNEVVPIHLEKRQAFLDKVSQLPPHQQHFVRLKLSEEEVSRFSIHQYRFPGVSLVVDLIRDYPFGELMAHVLGYVSEANKEELNDLDKKRYAGSSQLGKSGLEKFYESSLQGYPGQRQVEADVRGREVRSLSSTPAAPGNDLHLSIDIELQKIATQAMGTSRGALVALDPRTGEILALVSTPSFDPNQFVRGIDQASYNKLRNTTDRPLFNRAIQGQYPPGSTVKPIVALAGLATQKANRREEIFDPGWYQIKDHERIYRDWQKTGHGWTNLEKAIRESCGTFFYILSEKLGIQTLSTWLKYVGLGKATAVDYPGEQAGLVPTEEWKKKTHKASWRPGETLITGIGQGYMLATPIQLATLACYLGNQGHAWRPHFNKQTVPEKLPDFHLNQPEHWKWVVGAMHQVTAHPRGTAFRYFQGMRYPVAGKTGTAQVYGLKQDETYEHDMVADYLRDHSLFIAFAPVRSPTIALAVILENQRSSPMVARRVIEAHLSAGKSHAQSSQSEAL